MALHLVVMGVSGSGKSTIAARLAAELDLELAEGDDFHPDANVAKMASGEPLTDEDRWPWLADIAAWTAHRRTTGRDTAVTCSALKRAYRDVLRRAVPQTYFVWLRGDEELLRARMVGREHFMPPRLLASQLATLEPLDEDEAGLAVDAALPVDDIVALVVAALAGRTAGP